MDKHRLIIIKKVWITAKAILCPSIIVGEVAIIAAGAIVTKDVTVHALVAGNLAKYIEILIT